MTLSAYALQFTVLNAPIVRRWLVGRGRASCWKKAAATATSTKATSTVMTTPLSHHPIHLALWVDIAGRRSRTAGRAVEQLAACRPTGCMG